MRRPPFRQRGFSLVEMGVALVAIGIIGVMAWRWVATTQAPMDRTDMQRQLNEAQAGVEGFLLANHRLPCPAAGTDGVEACGNATAVRFPWRTLGMGSELAALHYGANRGGGADLAALPAAQDWPDFGLTFTEVPVFPALSPVPADVTAAGTRVGASYTAASALRPVVNGLDWCAVVRRLAANSGAAGVLRAGATGGSVPVGFVIAHPGANRQFDGNNAEGASATFRFDLPGRSQDLNYDDLMLAVGPGDLSARLGCAVRLSEMQVAMQASYAAYDTARVMQQYWSLLRFDIDQAESAVDGAESGVALAAMGLALATTSAVLSIASAANTEGVTAFVVVMAAVNVAASIAETVLAAQDLTAAQEDLQAARDKLVAGNAYAIHVYDSLADALDHAAVIDRKGLNP